MSQAPDAGSRGLVKSPLNLVGGLFLIAIAVIGFIGSFNLPAGTLSGIGSGLVPKAVAVLIGAFGALLLAQAFLTEGENAENWHVRGPAFVLSGVIVFALLIRGSTVNFGGIFGIPVLASVQLPALGLIVAGPLAMIVASFADKDTRLVEIVVFAVVMTLLAGLLFKELLNLPIPFDPMGLVPAQVDNAFNVAKSGLGQAVDAVKQLFAR